MTLSFAFPRRRVRRLPLAVLVVLLGAWGCDCSRGTVPPPGADFARWDPFAALPQVAAFAGPGAVLQSYALSFVKPDGTMDLVTDAYLANATFVYAVPAQADPSKPIGAGGFSGPGHEDVTVSVWKPGQWRHVQSGKSRSEYKHEGMQRTVGTAAAGAVVARAAPACAPGTLWQLAMQQGAPSNAVASIGWDGASYRFHIQGTDVNLRLDASCRLKP